MLPHRSRTGLLERPQTTRSTPTSTASSHRWTLLLAVGWMVQVLIRLWLASQQPIPSLTPDETGYLIAARLLTGGTGSDFSGYTFYQVGYSLLIAPAFCLSDDPHTVYRLVLVINALVSAALLLLAYLALRRLSVPRTLAYVLAHATALLPAVVYYTQFAMSDAVFPVVVLGWLLLVHSWLVSGRPGYGIAAGALAGYAYAVHSRGTVIVVVHAGLLAFVLLKRRMARHHIGIATQSLATVTALAWTLDHWLQSRLYPAGIKPLGHFVAERLTSLDGLAWTFSLGAGQIWYLIVCTWGVAGIGLVALAYQACRSTFPTTRTMVVVVLAVLAGIALASSAALPDEHAVNNFIYGRYLACLAPVLFLAGAATIVRAPRRRLALAFLATVSTAVIVGGIASFYAGKRLSDYPFLTFNFPEISVLVKGWSSLHLWQSTSAAILLLALAILIVTMLGKESDLLTGIVFIAINFMALIVITYQISWPMARGTLAAADLTAAGLRPQDRLAVDRYDLDFRIWMLHAFQEPWHEIATFHRNDPGSLPSSATVVVVPRKKGYSATFSWPTAPREWRPVLERDEWVAWRRGA
ncbi:MAG: hypothetical protein JWN00_1646 [Actinomycetia bacterium]|nr:hypothetical protein [Actinomycetes bacterium]